MCFSSGSKSANKIAQAQRNDEIARQQRITSGMGQIDQIFSGFTPEFYQKRAADYSAYAMPQIEQQATDQRKSLTYALARTGNLDSSAAIDKGAELERDANTQRVGAANDGLNQANTLRGQVENARGDLVGQLNATGDAQAAASSALRESRNLNQPAGFSPLGNLFADFASTVAQIGSRAGNGYSGFLGGGGAPLFATSGGAQRVVGR